MTVDEALMIARSSDRRHALVLVRIAVCEALIKSGHTQSSIGRFLGGRDHSTIIHYRNKAEIYREQSYRPYLTASELIQPIAEDLICQFNVENYTYIKTI